MEYLMPDYATQALYCMLSSHQCVPSKATITTQSMKVGVGVQSYTTDGRDREHIV